MQRASTKTLYRYWNTIRGSRSAPDRRDVDPARIRDALANTFILESGDGLDYDFRLAGSHLCMAYCRELKGRSFSRLWSQRDRDAVDTMIRAVTEDHAVALISFQGTTSVGTGLSFETILLPLRHNGSTTARVLGAMTAHEQPYWLGVQPVLEQRISGLRLIWPDDPELGQPMRDLATPVEGGLALAADRDPVPMPATVHGISARRYAHLAVIDGGRD